MMTIRVLFFAQLRERVQRREQSIELPANATIDDLWRSLVDSHPQLAPLGGALRFALNQEYVQRTAILQAGDEVALIPPVSGG